MPTYVCCLCFNKTADGKPKSQEAWKEATKRISFRCEPYKENVTGKWPDVPLLHLEKDLCPQCLPSVLEKFELAIPKSSEGKDGKSRNYRFSAAGNFLPKEGKNEAERTLPFVAERNESVQTDKHDNATVTIVGWKVPDGLKEVLGKIRQAVIDACKPKKQEDE